MSVTRRTVLQTAAVAGVGVATAGALAACSTDTGATAGRRRRRNRRSRRQRRHGRRPGRQRGHRRGHGRHPAGRREFAAFSTTCPHNQCPVNAVKGDAISCPCHGSEFSIEDGSVIRGPGPPGPGRADRHRRGRPGRRHLMRRAARLG